MSFLARLHKIRIQLAMKSVLAKQFKDAARKKKMSFHWGDIGWQVESAASQCAHILKWSSSETVEAYFKRVLPAISELASDYRHSRRDESGYALGTVREVERALIERSQL